MKIRQEMDHILMLATRDLQKFVRDSGRIVATFVFPIVFLGIFAVTLDAGIGSKNIGFSYVDYVFSGIILQTIFQSSFMGIVSLVSDREKDFSMSIFVAPISRASIIIGKILGESLVGIAQVLGILVFGIFVHVNFYPLVVLVSLPTILLASLVGGSMGIFVASRLDTPESAQRIFPFFTFPLLFLSGAFTPVNNLPFLLNLLKTINPLYYGVDMIRNVLFAGRPEYSLVVSHPFWYDTLIFSVLGLFFFVLGTWLFANKEGNK
jgi:ABC-2 type transport system permease protein